MRLRLVSRPGQLADTMSACLVSLQRETFSYVYVRPDAMDASYWWLAEERGETAGYCGLTVYESEPTGFLCLAGVLPAYRGLGLQRHMIDVRVRRARQLGCERVISYTSNDNVWSANNLIRCGFRLYTPRWLWGCPHAIYFQKRL